jgi:hypothetical protein
MHKKPRTISDAGFPYSYSVIQLCTKRYRIADNGRCFPITFRQCVCVAVQGHGRLRVSDTLSYRPNVDPSSDQCRDAEVPQVV